MRSVRDEIRYHVALALEGLSWPAPTKIYKGWVESEKFVSPSVTVLMGPAQRDPARGIWAIDETGPDTVGVTFIQSKITLPITLEMYTPNRTMQAENMPLIRALFYPPAAGLQAEPPAPGLELVLGGHHNAFARVNLLDDNAPDETEGGMFRARFELECMTHEMTRAEYLKSTFSHDLTTE